MRIAALGVATLPLGDIQPLTHARDPEIEMTQTPWVRRSIPSGDPTEKPPAFEPAGRALEIWDDLDVASKLALERLIRDGRLDDGLLDALLELRATELAPGIDRRELMRTILRDVADPSQIRQGKKFTCGATAIAISLARFSPAEYVRLVAGLASVEGRVTTFGGATIERQRHTIADDGSRRSLTGRLLQAALMQLGDGDLDYDNRTERHRGCLLGLIPGLVEDEVRQVAEEVLGGEWGVAGAGAGTLGRNVGLGGAIHNLTMRVANGTSDPWPYLQPGTIALVNLRRAAKIAIGTHYVSILAIRDGRVFFDDPNRITCKDPLFAKMMKGYRVEEDGTASLPSGVFRGRLFSVITPLTLR
jgi:hypothetical protein